MKIICALLTVWTGLSINLAFAGSPPGEVIGWGDDVAGQATGFPAYPFKDGQVIVGKNPYATGRVSVAGCVLTNAIAVAAGSFHSLALSIDGTVVGWGDNQAGRATGIATRYPNRTNGPVVVTDRIISNVMAIAAGGSFSLALKGDGTVVAWGNQRFYRDVPEGLSNVVAIAAGEGFCLAITTNKAVAERFMPKEE